MNVNDLKKSKFLTKNDVMPPVLATIESAEEVNIAKEGADPEMRWTLTFKELEKPLVLNSTNGQIIAAIVGSEESDDWIGHKIVLYNEPSVSFGGKLTGGIRCRAPETNVSQASKPQPKNDAPGSYESVVLQKTVDELSIYNALPKPTAVEQVILRQICKERFNDLKCEIKYRLEIWNGFNQNRWPTPDDDMEEITKSLIPF